MGATVTGIGPGEFDAITALVDLALEAVRGERVRLFLGGGGGLQLRAARNALKEDLRSENLDAAAFAKRVVRKDRSLAYVEVRLSNAHVVFPPDVQLKQVSVMAVPLRSADRILGVLYVEAAAEHRQFTDDDLRALEATATRLAEALSRNAAGK